MKKVYYFFKLLLNLSKIAKDEKNTDAAIMIADCLYHMDLLEAEEKMAKIDQAGTDLVSQRRMMDGYDIQKLNELPDGTLAKSYANHMISQNLQPNFYKNIPVVNDSTYIMMRMRETHDLWHILTGFNTTVPGELGLQAFMFAQLHTPFAPIVICGRSLVSVFKKPDEVVEVFENVSKGWQMGRKAKPIFGLDWEKNWAKPVNQLREEYQIVI